MKQKKLAVGLAILATVIIFAMVCALLLNRTETDVATKNFTVEIVHSDGGKRTEGFTSDVPFLGDFLVSANLIEGETGEYGLFITKVDGEEAIFARDNAYWALYVNGEYAMQGIDATPIEEGTVYSLKYEKSN